MQIEELIKNYTNEDGQIDYDALDKANNENIGAIVKKNRDKLKSELEVKNSQISELIQKSENVEKSSENVISELTDKVENLSKKIENNSKVSKFKSKAEDAGLDKDLVDNLIESGANLDSINLEVYKKPKAKLVKEEVKEQKSEVDQSKSKSEKLAKYFGL